MKKFAVGNSIFLIFGYNISGHKDYLKWLREVLAALNIDAKIDANKQPWRNMIIDLEGSCYNRERRQVEIKCLLHKINDLRNEIYEETDIFPPIVYVTNSDLFSKPDTNFVFGSTMFMIATAFSQTRFRKLRLWNRKRAKKYMFQHEIGHLFGAPGSKRPHPTEKLGEHCAVGDCVMQQSMGLDEAAEKSKKIKRGLFCNYCKKGVQSILLHEEYKPL